MYVCMYICVYVFKYTVYVGMYVYIYVCMLCICIRSIRMYICSYVQLSKCIEVYTYV
jgi:hypothetical protein